MDNVRSTTRYTIFTFPVTFYLSKRLIVHECHSGPPPLIYPFIHSYIATKLYHLHDSLDSGSTTPRTAFVFLPHSSIFLSWFSDSLEKDLFYYGLNLEISLRNVHTLFFVGFVSWTSYFVVMWVLFEEGGCRGNDITVR